MDGGHIELQYPHDDINSTIEKLVERKQSFDIVVAWDFNHFAAAGRAVNIFTADGHPGFWKMLTDSWRVGDLWGCFALALHETDYVATSTETEKGIIVSFDVSHT